MEGIHPKLEKVKAIEEFAVPKPDTEFCQYLGMVNFLTLSTFLLDLTNPLSELLRSNKAFQEIKMSVINTSSGHFLFKEGKLSFQQMPPLIDLGQYYNNIKRMTNFSNCLCLKDIVSIKKFCPDWKRGIGNHIAMECLPTFDNQTAFYETDYKPMVLICTTKRLDNFTPQLQRFQMRMMRYSFDIFHVPGKDSYSF